MSDTPRTDEIYARVWTPVNEEEATESLAAMRDHAQIPERENAKLRDKLNSACGFIRTAGRNSLADRLSP